MKRKKNNDAFNHNNKKIQSSNSNSGEKTLLDFWKPVRAKPSDTKGIRSKSKSVAEEIEKIEVKPTKTYNLIQNPSKHLIAGVFQPQNFLEYKNKILFNEDFVENFKIILEPFLENNKNNLLSQEISGDEILNEEVYEKFLTNNLENILIKFLLQIDDKFLFVPNSYMNKNDKPDKTKLKLIEGFNDSKYLCLQYFPLNSKEV
jgi:hypothetical protein